MAGRVTIAAKQLNNQPFTYTLSIIAVFLTTLTYKMLFNQNVTVLFPCKIKFPQHFINVSKCDYVSQNICNLKEESEPQSKGARLFSAQWDARTKFCASSAAVLSASLGGLVFKEPTHRTTIKNTDQQKST
ncbi:hypothetical protein PAQ92_004481 [Vibrio parahaemolyticus]|nr:hypothetical protein [Vibrio parahaemolyticus]